MSAPSSVRIGAGEFYTADCFDVFPHIADGSVDLVLTDLPYGTTQNAWDSVLPLDRLWQEYWRILKPRGAVVLTAASPFDKILATSCLKDLRYESVWRKSRPTGHLLAQHQSLRCHEHVLVFYRARPTYNAQGVVLKANPKRRSASTASSNYRHQERDSVWTHEQFPKSVLDIPSGPRTFHPTSKPVQLFEYLINTYTNVGDLILDNTAGAGTTAVAAEQAWRRWICIERDPGYAAKAIERIRETVRELNIGDPFREMFCG